MQTYVVEVTGPNGNGWFEPKVVYGNDYVHWFDLVDRKHPMDDIHPLPVFILPELLLWLNKKFAYNYTAKITPFTK